MEETWRLEMQRKSWMFRGMGQMGRAMGWIYREQVGNTKEWVNNAMWQYLLG